MDVLSPLQVGGVKFSPRLVLAPMSGVTNSAFRRLMRECNPESLGLVVTEFISIEGLTRENPQSVRMLNFRPIERPIAIQIFGNDIDRMCEAAKRAEDVGADIVDINSGCPVPKVVRRGGGCELMRRPDHLGKMLEAVKRSISVPLTLKIRSGWDEESRNAVEVAQIAESAGVSMLAVHGRTRVQLYRGESDWDLIAKVADAVSIPVIGSGDVVDAESAFMRGAKGVAGLMIGRGALGNPWIFNEIATRAAGKEYQHPEPWKVVDVMERYLQLLLEDMPEKGAIGRMKQMASQVTRRIYGGAPVRRTLCRSGNLVRFQEIMADWRGCLIGGKTLPAYFYEGQPTLETGSEEIAAGI